MANTLEIPETPWSLSVESVLKSLRTDQTLGLTTAEAQRRLAEYGPNAIPEAEPDPLWYRFWCQLTGDAVVRLLLIGGIVSFPLGDYLEGGAILLMLFIMASFGLWQEGKAEDAAKSLRNADKLKKRVTRGGNQIEVFIEEIVPGDIVYLPPGVIAPADGRVIQNVNAEKELSKLNGETDSVPVETDPLPEEAAIFDQSNMVHRGCGIPVGNVTMVVTATGGQTYIGKMAAQLAESEEVKTPLDEQLDQLGDAMAKIFLWMAVIVIGAGLVREFVGLSSGAESVTFWTVVEMLKEAFINAVALIIAAIPEGLPAVLTITLAIATKVMAKRNALVRRPKAVEGGGSMTVLLTDKTGTLTAAEMSVAYVYLNDQVLDASHFEALNSPDAVTQRALRIARLCNKNTGATEAAIMNWVHRSGFDAVGDIGELAKEHDFSQVLKRMTTVHPTRAQKNHYHILTKGAPERLLELCVSTHVNGHDVPLDTAHKSAIERVINDLAGRGLRVIALADRMAVDGHTLGRAEAERELTFVGLLGIMDPPRKDVAPAVVKLKKAGIESVMVTGDNPLTAFEVARMVGIVGGDDRLQTAVITGEDLKKYFPGYPHGTKAKERETMISQAVTDLPEPFLARLSKAKVFARVEPDHKEFIVRCFQRLGQIVGFTGDGFNDALALKRSDVGFAMGNGTELAKDASDLVLTDSRFGTIPNAVEEGRNVLHRIRLYLSYILSGNGCEVGAFIVAYALGIPIPLTALVLLIINFATDSFPALAMAFEAGEKDVMEQAPRRRGVPFINRTMWLHIGVQTLMATAVIMGVYYYALQTMGYFTATDETAKQSILELARSAAFMTYISQKLYRAFTSRSMTQNIWEIGVFKNLWTVAAVFTSLAIALFFVYVPVLNKAMGLAALDLQWIGIVAIAGLACPLAEEITKLFIKPTRHPHPQPELVS